MSIIEIILVAFSLAMDAFAVSIAVGTSKYMSYKRARFRIYFHFGLFQMLMPILGWFLGSTIEIYIRSFDHWIAFVLLNFVGLKMIIESFNENVKEFSFNPSKGLSLIILSIATSIDALAVGLSLAFLGNKILYPAIFIGLITGGLSLSGIHLGRKIGNRFKGQIELIGGSILCLLGIKILIEHIFIISFL